MASDEEIRVALTDLAVQRGAGKTFCPSDAARALSADWRPLMSPVRQVAADMQAEGTLQAFQKGEPVNPLNARDPIRLGLPQN